VIRKWTEKAEDVSRWLEEAARRREYNRAEPSFGAAAQLYNFSWDKKVDVLRPSPEAL